MAVESEKYKQGLFDGSICLYYSDGIQDPILSYVSFLESSALSSLMVSNMAAAVRASLPQYPLPLPQLTMFKTLKFTLTELIQVLCPPLNLDCDVEKYYALTDLGLGSLSLPLIPFALFTTVLGLLSVSFCHRAFAHAVHHRKG